MCGCFLIQFWLHRYEFDYSSPSLLNEYLWYDKLWGPSQRVVTLLSPSGDLRIGLVWDIHPTPPATFGPTVEILFKLNGTTIYDGFLVDLRMFSDVLRFFPMFSAVFRCSHDALIFYRDSQMCSRCAQMISYVFKMSSDVLRCSQMFSDDHRCFWIFSRYFSSQPSMVNLLSSSNFPCSSFVCRPAMVTSDQISIFFQFIQA